MTQVQTSILDQPWFIAASRALYGGLIVAGLAFFTALSQGQSYRTAGITAGAAFFGVLVTRGAAEGIVDQVRSR